MIGARHSGRWRLDVCQPNHARWGASTRLNVSSNEVAGKSGVTREDAMVRKFFLIAGPPQDPIPFDRTAAGRDNQSQLVEPRPTFRDPMSVEVTCPGIKNPGRNSAASRVNSLNE